MTEEQHNKERYEEALKSIREYDGLPPIEDLIDRPHIPLMPEMPYDSTPKPPNCGTMTDLQAQAKAYAVSILNSTAGYVSYTHIYRPKTYL